MGLSWTYVALVDSGTWRNRFDHQLALDVGLNLSAGERTTVGLGAFTSEAITVPVQLRLGDAIWTAPVSFCDPWPLDFQLLGLEGFFRFFQISIQAARYTVDVVPESEP